MNAPVGPRSQAPDDDGDDEVTLCESLGRNANALSRTTHQYKVITKNACTSKCFVSLLSLSNIRGHLSDGCVHGSESHSFGSD